MPISEEDAEDLDDMLDSLTGGSRSAGGPPDDDVWPANFQSPYGHDLRPGMEDWS